MKNDSDFYIGWQDKATPAINKPIRRVVIALFVLIPVLAGLLVWQQRGFSGAVFEYGQLTTVQGQLIRQPIPFLRMPVQATPGSAPIFKRILLIGLGKHGADSTLDLWEQQHGSLAGNNLTIRGTLIYHEGKAVLELTEQADALLSVSTPVQPPTAPVSVPLGQVLLQGEITDPKCFLGVMKPGDGRPHRSCAVRCIAGGVPPLLYVNNQRGLRNGYLLLGANGERIDDQLLAYVGRGMQLRGQLEQADNWLILRVQAPPAVMPLLADMGGDIALCH